MAGNGKGAGLPGVSVNIRETEEEKTDGAFSFTCPNVFKMHQGLQGLLIESNRNKCNWISWQCYHIEKIKLLHHLNLMEKKKCLF